MLHNRNEDILLLNREIAKKDAVIVKYDGIIRRDSTINTAQMNLLAVKTQDNQIQKDRYKILKTNDRIFKGIAVVVIAALAYLLITK